MRLLLFSALVLTFAACATMAGDLAPGYGVGDKVAAAACGSVEKFKERVAYFKGVRKESWEGAFPEIGWPLCDVYAAIGLPANAYVYHGTEGETLHMTYVSGVGRDLTADIITVDLGTGLVVNVL